MIGFEGGWDDIEEVLAEQDEIFEEPVSDELVQLGGDFSPRYAEGDLVVTPRLRAHLRPGELELYDGGLETRLRYYAWSRVDALGTGLVDPDSLVQDALIERLADVRGLSPEDVERFAIQSIYFASTKIYRSAQQRDGSGEVPDAEEPDLVPSYLPAHLWLWVQLHLSKKSAEAVRLVVEEQYTQKEAAKLLKISDRTVKRGFAELRKQASDQGFVP